jgi:mono/diheme cytochrome c family protein
MKKFLSLVLISTSALLIVGCEPTDFREGKIMAGDKYVAAHTLNKGQQIYKEYCMACHGVDGDGKGVAAKGLIPPPRNFKLGIIKFGDVASGDLPHDNSIYKTLTHGLNGTGMLPWDLKKDQMDAVWQYIKTFSPDTWEGKEKKLGTQIVAGKDPFGLARKAQAIEMGKEVYHFAGSCQACHRGYISVAEYNTLGKKVDGSDFDKITSHEEDYFQLKLQESDHGYQTAPPDFTWHKLRSIRKGHEVDDLYVRLSAGVGGTAMPAWRDTLEEQQIWALAYYIQSLTKHRNSATRNSFMSGVRN